MHGAARRPEGRGVSARAAHLSRRLEGESPLVKRSVVPYHLPLPLRPLVRPLAACAARAACAAEAAWAARRRPCSRLFDMHCLHCDRRRCWGDRSLRWRGRCRYRRRCCRQWRRCCRQWRHCLSYYMRWGRWSDCEPPVPCPTGISLAVHRLGRDDPPAHMRSSAGERRLRSRVFCGLRTRKGVFSRLQQRATLLEIVQLRK